MSKSAVVTTDSSEKQEAQLDAESIAQWNLPLEDVYRHSLSFLKDKEGSKALRLSYADKVQLVALEKQVTHGPYRADLTHDCGFFDVVGNDRKNAWIELGTMSRSAAMWEHVKLVHNRCPLFKAYIEAQKANQEREGAAAADSAQQPQALLLDQSPEHEVAQNCSTLPNVSDTDSKVKLETLSNDLQKLKLEEEQLRVQQEAQIRTLLNQQTAIQFRQYAQEQHPNDTKKQDELVRQLQQQHFQQYMTQVLKQQIEHQKQQARQIAALLRQQRKQQVEQPAAPEQQLDGASAGGLLIVDESNEDVAGSSRTAPPNGSHALSPLGASANATNAPTEQFAGADDVESNVDDETDADAELSEADDSEAGKIMMPQLIPASLWTRKDTAEFKQKVWKNNRECAIKIGSLATATVRVPTHPEGSCIFWEFATDNYDIGFGVYFEWNLDPGDKITVNISESDDEDFEDEDAPPNPEGKDPERGKKKRENEQPTDEIIPVYRRDSHEEVYCGSHTYPGKGVYLLKFDNSYSLWRSKWVYYRVYYGK